MTGARRKLLVVEDEMLAAMLMETMLTALGHAVVGPVAREEPALAAIERAEVDAVIVDVNLRGTPTFAVVEAAARRGIPYLFVTGYGRNQLPSAWGDAPLLQKPFTQARLAAALDALPHGPTPT